MNILFIAPIFFDYEKAIKIELEKTFDNVIFRCEVPFDSSLKYYALNRLSKSIARKSVENYNKSLIKLLDVEKINKVFVIRGYKLLPVFLEAVKIRKIELINFQWDSLKNNPNGLVISAYASKNISFDIADCDAYSQFTHLPLFYFWESYSEQRRKSKKMDIFFIGTYHSGRHIVVKELMLQCKEQGFNFKPYIYIPFTLFVKKNIIGERVSWGDVKFRKMSRKNYYYALSNSQAMLDIACLTQTGATIRTIETLSLGKKLISTNEMLLRENFYSSSNIYLWDCKSTIDIAKILSIPLDQEIKGLLSIGEWIKHIFK